MPFRRRRRPLHERLAVEGGLEWRAPERESPLRWLPPELLRPGPQSVVPALEGGHRAREWDAVRTTEAEGPPVPELAFVVVDDELVVIEGDEDVPEPMLAAFEDAVAPPYRVVAVRKGGALWSLGARRIEVVELPGVEGDEVELVVRDGAESVTTHGETTLFGNDAALLAAVGALRRQAAARDFRDYVARAERLDGPLWEVVVSPL